MIKHELSLHVEEAFGNLHRRRHVLVAAMDAKGFVLLGAKRNFYPPGFCRLLGGGVDEGEHFVTAARREIEEELVGVVVSRMAPLLHIVTHATDAKGATFYNETMVFQTNIGVQKYRPGSDITAVIKTHPEGLQELGERYEELSPTLWHRDKIGMFSWHDYGKLYGPIHRLTGAALLEMLDISGSAQHDGGMAV